MTDLGWKADGIERARAAGGVDLDLYRPPGFGRRAAVRATRCDRGYVGSGIPVFVDPEHPDLKSNTARKR